MKLCEGCSGTTEDYTQYCRACSSARRKTEKLGRAKYGLVNPYKSSMEKKEKFAIHKLSYNERYGLVKTEMPKQITLKRDAIGNVIYD